MLAEFLVENRPEHGRSVMYHITCNGVSETKAILERGMPAPNPLAGTLYGSGRFAQLDPAENRNDHRHPAHYRILSPLSRGYATDEPVDGMVPRAVRSGGRVLDSSRMVANPVAPAGSGGQ